jgi:3-hydroxyisobutyrate dehydrogenase-like beta-hydroxyacid dehydrogenase
MKAGYPMTLIANRNREPIDDLISRGAAEVDNIPDLLKACDVLFLCLPNTDVVDAMLHQEGGILDSVSAGQMIIDMTTSKPEATVGFAAELAAKGATFIDGPMTRTPIEAEEGRLNLLLGGDDDAVARARPIAETFCENVWHVGATGAGHRFKLLHNFMSITHMAVAVEAAVAASKLGIDAAQFLEIASQGGADSVMLRKILPYAVEGDGSALEAHASTGLKDLSYYNAMMDAAGMHTIVSKGAQQFFQLAVTMGHGRTHIPALYDPFCELNSATKDQD